MKSGEKSWLAWAYLPTDCSNTKLLSATVNRTHAHTNQLNIVRFLAVSRAENGVNCDGPELARPDVPVARQISALPILPPAAWCRINGHGRYGIYCPHILPDG